MRCGIVVLFIFFTITQAFSQDITNFTQFFFNPYAINPSYAGAEGQTAVFLGYRKQWATINGAPTIGNLSLHTPLNGKLNFGVNLANDQRGITKISAGMVSGAYAVTLDNDTYLRFGLSVGYATTSVDVSKIDLNNPNFNPSDPALGNLNGSHGSLIGNFGMSFHKKGFHGGIALPNIFQSVYLSKDAFSINASSPFQSVIIHASNRFYFDNDLNVFEPYVIYRLNDAIPSQFEVAGVLHLHNVAWVGASYKQQFGISGMGGFKLQNQFAVGISYSLQNSSDVSIPAPSYEVQLGYLFGLKKKDVNAYSFVNTQKLKPKRKTNAEILAERKQKQQQLNKKIEAEKAKHNAEILARANQKTPQKQTQTTTQQQKQPDKQVTPNLTQEIKTPIGKRDTVSRGGPRMKQNEANLDLITQNPTDQKQEQKQPDQTADNQHQEEQELLNRVDAHADNPLEEHGGEVVHPHAERHEFYKKGDHREEMDYGDYVISGVFRGRDHAESFSKGLKKMGFNPDFGYLTAKNLWYVYIAHTSNINDAKAERDKYRKMKIFRDSWLLTVQE